MFDQNENSKKLKIDDSFSQCFTFWFFHFKSCLSTTIIFIELRPQNKKEKNENELVGASVG
jgi:hypothetical protein